MEEQILTIPTLSFSQALGLSTSRIFQFTGRSRRSEYWWTMVVAYLIGFALTPLLGLLADIAMIPLTFRRLHDTGRSGWWYGVYAIMKFIVVGCLLFDFGMLMFFDISWDFFDLIHKYLMWIVIIFIYKIGLVVFMCLDSDYEANEYGDSPKYQIVDVAED